MQLHCFKPDRRRLSPADALHELSHCEDRGHLGVRVAEPQPLARLRQQAGGIAHRFHAARLLSDERRQPPPVLLKGKTDIFATAHVKKRTADEDGV